MLVVLLTFVVLGAAQVATGFVLVTLRWVNRSGDRELRELAIAFWLMMLLMFRLARRFPDVRDGGHADDALNSFCEVALVTLAAVTLARLIRKAANKPPPGA